MSANLTNLLPRPERRALRFDYFLRLATLGALLAAVVVAIHALLLLPTYFYGRTALSAKESELAQVEAARATGEERAIADRLAALEKEAAVLNRLAVLPTGSRLVRDLLGVPRPGIRIEGFTFGRSVAGEPRPRMSISGTAANRDSLRMYVGALGGVSFVERADVPISVYAKERDIPFTISLELQATTP